MQVNLEKLPIFQAHSFGRKIGHKMAGRSGEPEEVKASDDIKKYADSLLTVAEALDDKGSERVLNALEGFYSAVGENDTELLDTSGEKTRISEAMARLNETMAKLLQKATPDPGSPGKGGVLGADEEEAKQELQKTKRLVRGSELAGALSAISGGGYNKLVAVEMAAARDERKRQTTILGEIRDRLGNSGPKPLTPMVMPGTFTEPA